MKRTNRKLSIALLAAMASGGAVASAEVSTQVVSFQSGFDGSIISFEQFDTMNGTRQLTGLSLSYDQSITLGLTIESNGYTPLSEGDWLLQAGYNSLHQFGLVEGRGGDGDPGPPFIGPGAVFSSISADLGVSDGYNGTGPDTYYANISDSFVFNASYDGSSSFDQRMFDAFTGTGNLDTFLGGFTELFFNWINDPNWVVDPDNPPEGPFDGPFEDPYYGIFATISELDHHGEITVTYEYATVPTPAGAGLLLGAGLAGLRRRR